MHQRTWLSLLTLPLVSAFTAPMFHRQEPKPAMMRQGAAAADDPLAGLADLQDVLAHIRTYYVDVPDMGKALAGGIQAALERTSLLNSYLPPEEAHLPDPGPGETGVTLLKSGLVAAVAGIAPDSPAAAAGLQIGDWVRKIDGESIGPLSQWALERRLRGPIGSEVTLALMPSGSTEQKKIALKREKFPAPKIVARVDSKAAAFALPDLKEGRAKELDDIFKAVDKSLPLVVDLRRCNGGSYEEAAAVASLLGCSGTFAILQEMGQPDRPLDVPRPQTAQAAQAASFSKIAVLIGPGTLGPAEALAAAMKHLGTEAPEALNAPKASKTPKTAIFLGDRTYGQAVGRTRYPLKQGGAVELVTKHWMGPGGERLDMGSGGGRLDKAGLVPDYSLRGIPDDDILPRILEALEKGPIRPKDGTQKVARLGKEPEASPLTSP